MDVNRTRDKIAQVPRHTQRHMHNAWSERISCSPCFLPFIIFMLSLVHANNVDNSYPSSNYHCSLISFSCLFHYISLDYEQSNALPSTLMYFGLILVTSKSVKLYAIRVRERERERELFGLPHENSLQKFCEKKLIHP